MGFGELRPGPCRCFCQRTSLFSPFRLICICNAVLFHPVPGSMSAIWSANIIAGSKLKLVKKGGSHYMGRAACRRIYQRGDIELAEAWGLAIVPGLATI